MLGERPQQAHTLLPGSGSCRGHASGVQDELGEAPNAQLKGGLVLLSDQQSLVLFFQPLSQVTQLQRQQMGRLKRHSEADVITGGCWCAC